jgi:hypothetical protein
MQAHIGNGDWFAKVFAIAPDEAEAIAQAWRHVRAGGG